MSNIKYEGLGLRLKAILCKHDDVDLITLSEAMTRKLSATIRERTGDNTLEIKPFSISAIIDGRFYPDETYLSALSESLLLSDADKNELFYGKNQSSYQMASFIGSSNEFENKQDQLDEYVDDLFTHYNE